MLKGRQTLKPWSRWLLIILIIFNNSVSLYLRALRNHGSLFTVCPRVTGTKEETELEEETNTHTIFCDSFV